MTIPTGPTPGPIVPIKIGIVELEEGTWHVVSQIGHPNLTIEPTRTIYPEEFRTKEEAQRAALEVEMRFNSMYPGSVVE